jgi:dolichyl-phosphate-mannose-protein mannosyltransferase
MDGPRTLERRNLLFIAAATLMGLLVRLALPLSSAFPLNDGGLFYTMIHDLQHNGYVLPAFTTYNHASIPFAYPPLGLYAAGFISDVFHVDLLVVLRLAPALVSAAAIPGFYFLARDLLKSHTTAALATMLFGLTPRIFEWQIMGGGITRSFGFLFSVLSLYSLLGVYRTRSIGSLLRTSVLGALVILSHPEAIPQTALAGIILYLFADGSRRGLLHSSAAALGALLLASPWWISVISTHGLSPFLAALSAAGQDSPSPLMRFFLVLRFEFTDEPYLPFVAILAVIGIFVKIEERKPLYLVWMLTHYLLEPRGGSLYMTLPLAMLAGEGLERTLKSIARRPQPLPDNGEAGWWKSRAARGFGALLLLYLILGAYVAGYGIYSQYTLTPSQIQAMTWARTNTRTDSRFIVISNHNALADPVSEWLPALAERASLATVFGREWVNDKRFGEQIQEYNSLQACSDQDAHCLAAWAGQYETTFQYILIAQGRQETGPLARALLQSQDYRLTYQNGEVLILEQIHR